MKFLRASFVLIFISLAGNVFSQGCSQCKMLAEQGSELSENSFGTGINSGILYIMIIPYIIFFVLMFIFRKKIAEFFRSLVKAK